MMGDFNYNLQFNKDSLPEISAYQQKYQTAAGQQHHHHHHQQFKTNNTTILRPSRSSSATGSSDPMLRERENRTATENNESVSLAAATGNLVAVTTTANSTVMTGSLGTSIGGGGGGGGGSGGSGGVGGVGGGIGSGIASGGGSGVGVTQVATFRGFRSQSPSNRRSRERSRTHIRSHGSDQGGLLAYGSLNSGVGICGSGSGLVVNDLTNPDIVVNSAMGTSNIMEDARLSGNEDLCYQSFASDELDVNQTNNPLTNDHSKKSHRHHERILSLQALDRLNTKIQCTKESIRKEQTARDDNVNEYLKLAASADKQQLQRIKAVFEKKNQKSAHSISQLQKKLDNYSKRVKDLQNQQFQNKSQHRQPREVLRDVGQGLRNVGGNIRDGITGFSGSVMSKPREFAHLIKNKFGSADNINHLAERDLNNLHSPANQDIMGATSPNNAVVNAAATALGIHGAVGGGSSSGGGAGIAVGIAGGGGAGGGGGGVCCSSVGGTGVSAISGGSGKLHSENGSDCSGSITSGSLPAGSGKSQSGASQYHIVLKSLLTELAERKAEIEKLSERVETLENAQKEINNLTTTLESERYRAESLEEQINDLTELHQNEIENLKQAIADMEEKVQYQSDERLQDVNDVLENCQTRISKMEHLSQQQYVTVDGIENSNARDLVVKLINVVLIVLQVILLMVATASGIIMPFLKTRVRVLTTFLTIFLIICVIRQWPDVQDIGTGLLRHLKQSLVVK